ncbi:uracil nucleotide/cysteinyl leukotriene receptor [Conger conger]|uniref:uracil nucleotide/cysteinyl leukotriene receptor n=1 Tax=Conger conger TaxID=82655 RepID=UPI002A5AF867|nr:uracil nucleotide/cysteinyl leukotriene receptor [Conger conger]
MMFNNSIAEDRIDRYAVGSHQENVLFASFYTMVFILAVPGNILALWVFVREKKNTPTKVFLKNLAVADISYLATLPMRVVYHLTDNNWPLGEIPCRVLGYFFYLNMYCSLYFMAFISVDRFIALVLPVRSLKLRKPLYASVGSAILWLCLTVVTMPLLLSKQTTQVNHSNSTRTICMQLYREKTSPQALVSTAVAFSIPLVTIAVSYILILHRLWSRRRQQQRSGRQKATRMIVLVLVNFTVAFLPYHVSRFVYIEGSLHSGDMGPLALCNRITSSLTCVNGVLDPVLYFFLTKTYRNSLLQLFHKRNLSNTSY